MIEYIKGTIADISPAHVVLETGGVGYFLAISLNTYTALVGNPDNADSYRHRDVRLYVHEAIREDAHTLYGFLDRQERQMFLLLISVSGIGANTARMILSSYSAAELEQFIASGNVTVLKSIKGIGQKTAERIIVDLRGKVQKSSDLAAAGALHAAPVQDEALSALVMLGFQQAAAQKTLQKIVNETPALSVEQLIKAALKLL